jgi:hypothetical protein
MLPYLKLIWYYKFAYYKYVLGITNRSTAYNDAIKTNFRPESFRFPGTTRSDRIISLRIFKKILFSQFKKQKVNIYPGQTVAIFDNTIVGSEKREKYFQRLSGDQVKLVIGRSELINSVSPLLSLFTFLSLLSTFPLIFLVSFFSKNKLYLPLLVLNLYEGLNFIFLTRKYEIKKLHFFCIYENDSNLLAFVLMKCGVSVNKIPSEVPLQFWNKNIIADTLSFCFRYQQDEFNEFKKSMHVKGTLDWVPENSLELEPIYKNRSYEIKNNTVGFYSSGMWLRQRKGQLDLNAAGNEKKLLELLLDLADQDPALKLIVFLHPIEKKEMDVTKEYYNSLSGKIEFADTTKPNPHQFYNADVVVSLFSTLSYERLFWGYKTLIYPIGNIGFPIKNSTFNNVCIHSDEELYVKVKETLNESADQFFKRNGLVNYRYSEYPFFK